VTPRRTFAALVWGISIGALVFVVACGFGWYTLASPPQTFRDGPDDFPKKESTIPRGAPVYVGGVVGLFAGLAGGVWRYTRPD
jgi:hypothetical protein